MGYKNFEKIYKKMITGLLKKFRAGEDEGNIEFLKLEAPSEECQMHAIVVIDGEIEKIGESPDPTTITPIKGKKPQLDNFEHIFPEKTFLFPTISDKIKIIAFNKNYDRLFRDNLYDLIHRLYGIEEDKETYEPLVIEEYNKIYAAMLSKLAEKYQKEAFEMKVALPKEGGDEEEEKEDKEDDEEK